MIILDSTTDKIQALLTAAPVIRQPSYVTSFQDITTTAVTPGENDGAMSGVTAVDIVASPASSTQRRISHIFICNNDTAEVTALVRLNANGTMRNIIRAKIPVSGMLMYVSGEGFRVLDMNSGRKLIAEQKLDRDIFSYYHKDNTAGLRTNYLAACGAALALSTTALVADTWYATPFVTPARSCTVDRIGVYVTTGVASAKLRLGIYSNSDGGGTSYPKTKLYGSGELDVSSSSTAVTDTPNLALDPRTLYWAVMLSSSTSTLRAANNGGFFPFYGQIDSLNSSTIQKSIAGKDASFLYGALPESFPPITATTTAQPSVFIRYSA